MRRCWFWEEFIRFQCNLHEVSYSWGSTIDYWLGYLEKCPDYWTQGESLENLKEHLKYLYEDLSNERIPEARRVAELEVS